MVQKNKIVKPPLDSSTRRVYF